MTYVMIKKISFKFLTDRNLNIVTRGHMDFKLDKKFLIKALQE